MNKITLGVLILTFITGISSAKTPLDPNLPSYKKTSGVSGKINSIGSDTLNNLMTFSVEGFKTIYPNVIIQIEGKGSSTAPPALIEGTSQLGPMSRKMKSSEIDKFEKKFGYKPTAIPVAIDALAVFAHKDNPIKGLTLKQVDGIFSSTYRYGSKVINTWGEVKLSGVFKSRPISLYGRNSASGTYGFFKSKALDKGDFSSKVKEQPGSSAVVQGIAKDKFSLGYSGIGYKTSGVKTVQLGTKAGNYYSPTLKNCMSGKYPLARFLYVYINKAPGKKLNKLTGEFLKFILSKEGQKIVVKDGYYPLNTKIVKKSLKDASL